MKKITFNQFKELILNYDNFEQKNLQELYSKYGKEIINKYFDEYYQSLNEEEIMDFAKKYSVYFETRLSVENNNEYRDNALDMVIKNISKYPEMTKEEEYEQGTILQETNRKLTIIKKNESILYPNLNIESILLSIKI